EKEADDAVRPVPVELPALSVIGLEDQKEVPEGCRPIMDMNGPRIVGQITPIIPKYADLHDRHRDDHPEIQAVESLQPPAVGHQEPPCASPPAWRFRCQACPPPDARRHTRCCDDLVNPVGLNAGPADGSASDPLRTPVAEV